MIDSSLLAPDSGFGIFALLALIAGVSLRAETCAVGARISGVVIAILCGMLFSNLRILPFESPVYDFIWSHGLLFGLVILLLQADLRRILRETGRVLLAFCLGAIGTVLGALAAFMLFSETPHAAELSGIFAASYIGGSINFLATSQALGMDAFPEVQAGGLAADNLVMACYFVILFALPQIGWMRRLFVRRRRKGMVEPAPPQTMVEIAGTEPIRAGDVLAILALGAGICMLAEWGAGITDFPGDTIVLATTLAVGAATLGSRPLARLRGSQTVGMALMQLFFVVIGATASVAAVIRIGPVLVLFLSVILAVHLLFLLVSGWLLRLDIDELSAASNANCGGPTTAAAMALAKGWQPLVVPVILCGTFGYAVANFIGIGLARLLGAGG